VNRLPISVLILSHNGVNLNVCLDRLAREPFGEVVVLNNGGANTVDRSMYGWVKFHDYETNLGCVGGRNLIARQATFEWLLFLDDDQFVSHGSIARLYEMALRRDYDFVGCMLNETNAEGIGHPLGSMRRNPRVYLGGGGLLVKRGVWDKLGGLDEIYSPAYCSDVDFHWRAVAAGCSWGWLQNHGIKHQGGATMHSQKTWGHDAQYERSHAILRNRWAERLDAKRGYSTTDTIGVVVICHNRYDWLKKCIDRLMATTHEQTTKIYILNNGSTDSRVAEYLESINGGKVRIYSSETNLLCAPGREYLLSKMFKAGGVQDVLFFLDDDIMIEDGWEQAIKKPFAENPEIGVVQGLLYGPRGNTQSGLSFIYMDENNLRRTIIDDSNADKHGGDINYGSGGFSAWRSEIVRGNYMYLKLFAAGFADHDQALRAQRDGVRFLYNRKLCGLHLKSRAAPQTGDSEVAEWRTEMNRARSVIHFIQMWGKNPETDLRRLGEIDAAFEARFGFSFKDVMEIGFKKTEWLPGL